MRALAFSLVAFLSIGDVVESWAAGPQIRPALIGTGPNALINMIDTKKLMEKGQRDVVVMFNCLVDSRGKVPNAMGYIAYMVWPDTPESKFLKEELKSALSSCHFIPAVYNGEPTEVRFVGTIAFLVRDGKPHLRIYANQSEEDLAKGNDFIAPQLLVNTPDWEGSQYDLAAEKARVNLKNGIIQLAVTVDTNGNQTDLKVVWEKPSGFGLGTFATHRFAKAKWIPGFRNGHPVNCRFEVPMFFM